MAGKPLLTPDELKALPKGEFIVMKTGRHPMRTRLRLFLKWGITFEEPYAMPPRENGEVRYADKKALISSILERYGKVRCIPGEKLFEEEGTAGDHKGMKL